MYNSTRMHVHTYTHALLHNASSPSWVLFKGADLLFAELTELFKNYKFVGCVDQTRSLVQYMVCHCPLPPMGLYVTVCVSSTDQTLLD